MADILSVGIDIGTSTTQVVFSRLSMENTSGYCAVPRVSIVEKTVLYKSEIHMTPLKTAALIDGAAVRKIVEREYRLAGYCRQEVDTGAVIITGESARKENAAEVLEKLSDLAGDFVVSTAGPDLEAVIAGKGSGAFQYSLEHSCTVVNLDIGGGTTNLVMFDGGDVTAKGCLDIGGRLVRLSKGMDLEYVSPAAERMAAALGFTLRVGDRATLAQLTALTDKMAELLAQALGLLPQQPLLRALQTPESTWFHPSGAIHGICFSGGVADCIGEGMADIPYGDIGALLGRAIARSVLCRDIPRIAGGETIRATVVGAGTYTTSLSGSTIAYSAGLLPLKNIPVLRLSRREQAACLAGERGLLGERMDWFLRQSGADSAALAMEGESDPDYLQLKALARYLAEELDGALPPGQPVILVLEHDIAKALGQVLRRALGARRTLICIDGVAVEQGDYVDLGRPVLDGMVIPLVVKTLLFGA